MAEIQGTLEFADSDTFMEFHDWSLLDYSPRTERDEFAVREGTHIADTSDTAEKRTVGELWERENG